MNDNAERSAIARALSLPKRIVSAFARGVGELVARLRASLWLIIAVAVILTSLMAVAGLTFPFALAGVAGFILSVLLLPRHGADQVATSVAEQVTASARGVTHMQAVAGALPDPAILLSPAGHVLYCNPAARGLFLSLRQGSHIASVIRTPEFLDAVSGAPMRNRAVTVLYSERVPVGRRMAATVAPVGRAPDRHILVLLRDLTEVERINQMRADFIANASHELRTPLASLRGFIETLQGTAKEDPAARERFLAIMAEQASRMTRLIDALLSLSRVEMNAHVPPSGRVDLNEVLDHVRDALDPVARHF